MMVCSTRQNTCTAIQNLSVKYNHYATLQDLRSTLNNKLASCYNKNRKTKSTITELSPTVQNLPLTSIQSHQSLHMQSSAKLIYSPARKIYKYWLNRYVPYTINLSSGSNIIHNKIFFIKCSHASKRLAQRAKVQEKSPIFRQSCRRITPSC